MKVIFNTNLHILFSRFLNKNFGKLQEFGMALSKTSSTCNQREYYYKKSAEVYL
jgi:hypothetical protein